MRIVQLNLAYDPTLRTASALLERYSTLTESSAALVAAGASVRVVQRFSHDASSAQNHVPYAFVCDNGPPMPSPAMISQPAIEAVLHEPVEIVHVNGLMFPAMVAALKSADPAVRVVVQDHAGHQAPSRIERLREAAW